MRSSADKASVLIIGCGNTLRGDDGLGCAAVDRLRQALGDSVDLLFYHQLMPELSEPISRADLVILVDARENCEPGKVVVEPVVAGEQKAGSLNHHVDLPHLLSLADRLYGGRPRAFAVSVGGESWEFSQSLSPKVLAAMPELIKRVEELVAMSN